MRRYGALKAVREAVAGRFAIVLRRVRAAREMTLRDLGEAAGIPTTDLHRIEMSERLPPKRDTVCKLARHLKADPIDFLAAAAEDIGAVEIEGLTPEQVREVVILAERLRSGTGAPAKAGAS